MKNFNNSLAIILVSLCTSTILFTGIMNNPHYFWQLIGFIFSTVVLAYNLLWMVVVQERINQIFNNIDSSAVRVKSLVDVIISRFVKLGTKEIMVTNFYYYAKILNIGDTDDRHIQLYFGLCNALWDKYLTKYELEKNKAKKEKIAYEYNKIADRLKLQWYESKTTEGTLRIKIRESVTFQLSSGLTSYSLIKEVMEKLSVCYDYKLLASELKIYLNGEYENIPDKQITEYTSDIYAILVNQKASKLTDHSVSLCNSELLDLCKTTK